MTVSRERLYEQVWAEPMTAVAKQYEVSSNYLARICQRVGVPVPSRGYWEKARVGRGPSRPSLPPPEPGAEVEWRRDWTPARRAPRAPPVPPEGAVGRRRLVPVPDLHRLLVGARESFEKARPNSLYLSRGFLRPYARKLPDIVVTRESLHQALEAANALYLHLERRTCPVSIAARGLFERSVPETDGRRTERFLDEWIPYSPTVVHVRKVAFGLRLFETMREVETVWVNGKRVPLDSLPARNRRAYGAPTTTSVPTGLLALAAYSPYPDTSWHKKWNETSAGSLSRMSSTIRHELEAAAPAVARLAAEADVRADEARRRWEEQQRKWEEEEKERARQELERRRQQATKDSRDQLLAIVENWALANRVEDFFRDVSRLVAAKMGEQVRKDLEPRLVLARQLLGGTNAVAHFKSWKTPEEHYSGSAQRATDP
jgi:hypothetical protein